MIFNKAFLKENSGLIKIPTLLGLVVILLGLAAGVYLVSQNQTLKSQAAVLSLPKDVNIYNLSAKSAIIFWQTDTETTGFVKAGKNSEEKNIYQDDRDIASLELHNLHFVTLTNLEPEVTYNYQIFSGPNIYPDQPASFATPSQTPALNWNPIVGIILDEGNKPVSEALVILELNNAQRLAAITKVGGNFILPLSQLRTADLKESYPESNNPYRATLKIVGPSKTSSVEVLIPPSNSALAPITLGKNIDLTQNQVNLSAEIKKYDLNGDNLINATDLSIILKNFGALKNLSTTSAAKRADLNGDNIIDQKDVDLIIPYLK